ncbi:MAG: delta-lactam-biosynthetic de-N-acetylase [Lachnospiraceae bacterium]|nr:delta-lactam-biosynthetic de-N-acetylase [Lachnospiraceae bacterium]
MKKFFLLVLVLFTLSVAGCKGNKENIPQISEKQEEISKNDSLVKEAFASGNEENEEEKELEEEKEPEEEKEDEEDEITKEIKNTPSDEILKKAPDQPTENSSSVGYNDKKSWWFKRNSEHTPPSAQMEIDIRQYGGYYLGNTDERVIYLTFDEGYENGYTSKILDVLKENDVKAAFFVTEPYIEKDPELILRMKNEGHVVGNHTTTHPEMPSLTDDELFGEITQCENAYAELTGEPMDKFLRPPGGVYSIRTLEKTLAAGYKTIFWSYAYKDWEVDNQPGTVEAYNMFVNNYHNGAIILLHAVSQSNTEALNSIIKTMKEKGYRFASLYELPEYDLIDVGQNGSPDIELEEEVNTSDDSLTETSQENGNTSEGTENS